MQGSDALNTVPTELRGTQTRTTNEWIMTVLRSCPTAVVGIQSGTSNVLLRCALLNLCRVGAACRAIQLTSDALLRSPSRRRVLAVCVRRRFTNHVQRL